MPSLPPSLARTRPTCLGRWPGLRRTQQQPWPATGERQPSSSIQRQQLGRVEHASPRRRAAIVYRKVQACGLVRHVLCCAAGTDRRVRRVQSKRSSSTWAPEVGWTQHCAAPLAEFSHPRGNSAGLSPAPAAGIREARYQAIAGGGGNARMYFNTLPGRPRVFRFRPRAASVAGGENAESGPTAMVAQYRLEGGKDPTS